MHAGSGDGERCGVVLCGVGLAFHLEVVPEGAAHALASADGAVRCHQTLVHEVARQVAALHPGHFLLFVPDALQDAHTAVGHTVVVAPKHGLAVGVGTDHGDALLPFPERQHTVLVLQQHDGFTGHVEGQLTVFLAVHGGVRNLRPRHQLRIVHLTQVEATFQEALHVLVHLLFGEESLLHSLGDRAIDVVPSALHVGTGQRAHTGGVHLVAGGLVVLPEVAHGATVAHHKVLEAPFVSQDLLEQAVAAAAGLVLPALVGTHHLSHLSLLHQVFEGGQIGLVQVAQRHIGHVGGVARVFRSAVHGVVLGAGPQFAVFAVFGALQTLHHHLAHHTGQIGVFAVGLLSASPARVAEDVDVGGPHAQRVEFLILSAIVHALVVLGAHLGAGGVKHAVEQIRVEGSCHTDGFGENGDVAHVGRAVQRFAPPVELLDAQTRDGG